MAKTEKRRHVKKNKTRKNDFKGNCSPLTDNDSYTCYSEDALIKMRELWNRRHPTDKIETKEPRKIWEEFRSRYQNVCNSEQCLIRQKFVENKLGGDILSYTFVPAAPNSWKKNINEWLSSNDIINVMKQYEKKYKCFEFLGPSPIDFDKQLLYGECVWEELCKFDLQKLISKGKYKIGIIFNTDPHNKNGEHWVSLFINVRAKPSPFIFYFDSNGDPVIKEIQNLVDRIIEQGHKIGIDFVFNQNHPKQHQYGDSECGMYSLYFIIELLKENKKYDFFIKNRIADKEVEEMRNVYFNIE
jgi:ribulose bisphosphate carboxylase small subunit